MTDTFFAACHERVRNKSSGNKDNGEVRWVIYFIDRCKYISLTQLSLFCSHRKDLAYKPKAIQIINDDAREVAGSRGDAKNSNTLRVEELFH